MRCPWILALAIGGCFVRVGFAADEPAITHYEEYVRSISSIAFHSKFSDRLAESKTFTNTLSQDWKLDFVNKRKWCTTDKPTSKNRLPSKISSADLYSEQLVKPDQDVELSVNPRTDRAEVCCAFLTAPANVWESNQAGLSYLANPFGYLQTGGNYQNLVSLLRSDDVKDIAVKQTGPQTFLKCVTSVYEVSWWLNPEKGWMPEQIECKRLAATTDSNQLVYSKYVVKKASQHDGIWLPDSFTCQEKYSAGVHHLPPDMRVRKGIDGKYVYWTTSDKNAPGDTTIQVPASSVFAEVAISEVKVNRITDDDFHLHAIIPDGLQVSMQDDIHEKYHWQEGKIVPCAGKK
jgi:hypothetical protein